MASLPGKTSRIVYLRHFADLEAGGITRDSVGLISDLRQIPLVASNLVISFIEPKNSPSNSIKRRLNLPINITNSDADFVWLEQILPVKKSSGLRPIIRVHDIFPITNPRWFRFWTVLGFRKNLKVLLGLNPILVFNSNASLSIFVQKYPAEKYLPIVIWCKPNNESRKMCGVCEGCSTLRNSLLLEKYCLLIGTIEPRKNYRLVIDMFTTEFPRDLQFVVIGRYGWKQSSTWRKLRKLNTANLMLIDNACDGARLEITKNASVFLSTSLNEGFGMPAAEARSLGIKLVLADIPVYREIHGQGDGVTYVSLGTPAKDWLKALDKSLQSSNGDEMWIKRFEETRIEQFSIFLKVLKSISMGKK